ncbi:ABC transporter ATP-binding protein [Mycetocola reblochoni]|uniref:ATP-binding transport protein NatA n=2 Tax=Mycetocola reblochoni TaxID=331618 RepID=A0A1R4J9B4_9MICO|nr:ABC transporter ATP-binding protein [Mycetocola reblochoni]SJN28637.1 ATP-binding transport protein NatA [Mycetocola reblochoni REB411]
MADDAASPVSSSRIESAAAPASIVEDPGTGSTETAPDPAARPASASPAVTAPEEMTVPADADAVLPTEEAPGSGDDGGRSPAPDAPPTEDSLPAAEARQGNWFTRLMGVVTRRPATAASTAAAADSAGDDVIVVTGLRKSFGETTAVDGIDLTVRRGTFAGIVGPNGAGKTTTLSMMTGLLRPDAGEVAVNGVAVWDDPERAKRMLGVLPDRLRLFDRLTGAQLIYYAGVLRGVDAATVRSRIPELAQAFGIVEAINRPVSDYSVGMAKKVALASAMIHSPRVLVLDEPFESMDPVSTSTVVDVLKRYVEHGGTVVLSSHSMDLIARVCDDVVIIVDGDVLAAGTVAEVSEGGSLEERFLALVGGAQTAEGMEWLHTFSD